MRAPLCLLPLLLILAIGCETGSVVEPESVNRSALTPADGTCDPDAYPC